jgi:hypothetical protein
MNLYGIWIDHAHAFVVKANPSGDMTVRTIDSGIGPHFHTGKMEGEHSTIFNQHQSDERRKNETHAFMKVLLEALHDADEIVVFGPGNARHDLKNALEDNKTLAKKLVSCETTDKMTENQLMAHVKEVFRLPRI